MLYVKSYASHKFGSNVKAIKRIKRLTLDELSEMSGVSKRQLGYIMAGKDTTLITADNIASALGYTLVGLIQWRAKP